MIKSNRCASLLMIALLAVNCSQDDAETTSVHELTATEHEYYVAASGGTTEIQFYSNGHVRIEPLHDIGDWATISSLEFNGDQKIVLNFSENTSFRRMVKLRCVLDGGVRVDTISVKQYGIVPSLECQAPYQAIPGNKESITQFAVDTNIPLEDFEIQTTYAGTRTDWVRDLQYEPGLLIATSDSNPSDEISRATITLRYIDGWDELFSAELYITQADKDDEFGQEITFDEARSLASAEGTVIHEDLLIEGIVVSDFHSENMEVNPNTSYDQVDVSINKSTAYFESLDGRYGFRLQFDTARDNVLVHGTRLLLSLNGATMTCDENPRRYTICSLVGENMVHSVPGEMIPVKERFISELTDDDIYTYVSLQNTEFLFKNGCYANVYENYTLSSDVNASLPDVNNRMDGWASLLIDNQGNSIYAPVNMLCSWRRSGQGIPQGVGKTHGILVHNDMPRYGNVGRYQIRVLDETGFDMEWGGESAYTDLAEWDGDPYKYLFGSYAKINSRYAYQGLESITPSDDISMDKKEPVAELFCENHVKAVATESWPLVGIDNYNDLTADNNGISSIYKGYALKVDVKGWYQWADGEVVGYNGLRLEFSTENLNGTQMLLGFSFAAGNITAQTSKTYPAHWCVEYSLDNGQSYILCKNATTGADYVHLRSLPWWDASIGGNRYYTCSSAGMGLTDHVFFFPQEIFGKEKVMIRIRPYDKVMTVLPFVWNGDVETAEINSSTSYDNRLRWGAIMIRYR